MKEQPLIYDIPSATFKPVTQDDLNMHVAFCATFGPLIRLHGDALMNATLDAWIDAGKLGPQTQVIRLPGSEKAHS